MTRAVAEPAWLKQQIAAGRRAAAPAILVQLVAVPLAIGQAWIVASVLGRALLGRGVGGLPWAVLGFCGCAILRALLGWAGERASVAAGAAGRRRLRHAIVQRIIDVGPGLLRDRHSGDLVALVVDRVESLDGLFARWIPAAFLAIAAPAVVASAALMADRFAGLVMIAAGLLMPLAMALSGIGAALAARQQFAALARLQVRFLDRVRGIATIVLAGRAEDEAQALGRSAAALRRHTMRVLRVAFVSSSALDCAMAATLVLLVLHDVRAGVIVDAGRTVRALFGLLLVPEFFAPVRTYAAAYQDRFQARAMGEAWAALPAPAAPPAAVQILPPIRTIEANGVAVAFDGVDLTWDAARGAALREISFRLPAGETLIVAGPSGAGKSSLIELLLGFARPDRGAITLNGMRIETIMPAALARMTAWIGQRPLLIAGTLRENIRFGRAEASDAEVEAAAAKARLSAVVAMLPQGLETMLGEGGFGLSGGQAQRVAIARAYLRDAPLLLLDEPTAHLDPATEAEVLESLQRLAVGRTVVLASHSAAALAFKGRRLDLREGRIVAVGQPGQGRGAA